jgi:hypothetical protein
MFSGVIDFSDVIYSFAIGVAEAALTKSTNSAFSARSERASS